MTSISLGSSLRTIGEDAFAECYALTSITIPTSVTSIEGGAFNVCNNLTSVNFAGTIAAGNFSEAGVEWGIIKPTFFGDLRAKYLAGGPGTYTTTAPVNENSVWTKQ